MSLEPEKSGNAPGSPQQRDHLSPVKRALLERLMHQGSGKKARTIPKRLSGSAPALPMQRNLWLLHHMDPDSMAYHTVRAWRLRGPLDVPALERALHAVQQRHESLRTSLVDVEGELCQQVHGTAAIALTRMDLSSDPHPEAALAGTVEELSRRPFDLAKAPLWRTWLIQMRAQDHVLLVVFHHILLDLWSLGVFARDLSALYSEFCGGPASQLPELTIQYGDFAAWESKQPESRMPQHPNAGYWKDRLNGISLRLDLPSDRPRPAVATGRGRQVRFELDPQVSVSIRALGRNEQSTPYMTLLASWAALLHRYSGQTAMVVGSPTAGRNLDETRDLIGLFVDSLVVPVDFAGDPTFRELLRGVRTESLATFDHPIPFLRLVEAIRPERHPGQNPIFQGLFAMQNVPPMKEEWHGLQPERLPVENQAAKFDLSLYVFEEARGLRGYLEYSTDLFEEATARRWLEHWKVLLAAVCENPDQCISQLPILTAAERQQILVDWNRTETPFSHDRCFPELFDEQATLTPDATAVLFEGQSLTYRELRERSDRLAAELRRRGVGRESLVGLCLERSPFLLVALLGIMKAGGAYVPLDPAFPAERLKFVLEDGPIRFLITEGGVRDALPEHSAEEIRREGEAGWSVTSAGTADGPKPGDLVYVLYTSGSTGKPKGVAVTHRSLVNLLESIRREPGFARDDRLPALTTVTFDIAALELYLPLLVGSSVVLASRETALDPALLARVLKANRVTVMQATPVTWKMLLDSGWAAAEPIQVWSGGEALSQDLAARMLQNIGPVWNLYGPTETTIYSTGNRIAANERPTIGRPIANTQVYILDRNLQPVPVGIPGELYIGGEGLARGYLGRPDLTEERFITVPPVAGSTRLYKTGDLARYRPDGRIEYLGRLDFQVKLRGFRIELGDIETHLREYPAVSDAAVTLREDIPSNPCLVAYLASVAPPAPSSAEIRAFLVKRIPDYMIPSSVVILDTLPLTANGKVDRKALPAPPRERSREATGGPPLSPLEVDLITLWESLLEVRPIGPLDNFFDLGGSSLMAAQVFAGITTLTGRQLSLSLLFRAPTVRQLAEAIRQQQGTQVAGEKAEVIPRRPPGQLAPASPAQRSLWFLDQFHSGSAAYNIARAWRFRGVLDKEALQNALLAAQQRHGALRSALVDVDAQLKQVVQDERQAKLIVQDLSRETDPDAVLTARLEEYSRQPFDLSRAPLWRAWLLRLSEQEHVLLTVFHHAIQDLWSVQIFWRDLSALYNEFSGGVANQLPLLPIEYGDYTAWEETRMRDKAAGDHLVDYWTKRLAGNPLLLEIPSDHPRPAIVTDGGRRIAFDLAREVSTRLGGLGKVEQATRYMTLLAAFSVLLSRYCSQTDLVIGSPTAGRNREEARHLIGPFVDTLVVRLDLSGDPTFRELLKRVRHEVLETFDHPIPFQRLVDAVHPQRREGQNPLFQVFFALQNVPLARPTWNGLSIEPSSVDNRTAKFDLSLYVNEEADALRGELEYSTDLFEDGTARRCVGHLQRLLEAICENPDQRISQLPILTAAEGQQILVDWNRTTVPFPQDRCLPELFDDQAARTPDAPAVVFEGRSLTYRDLRERSDRLAVELRRRGVQPDSLVGLCLERSPSLVVALLGIMKAGGAYVPMDPAFPAERLRHVLTDGPIGLVVTERAVRGALPEHAAQEVYMDEAAGWPTQPSVTVERPSPDDLAYVLYTSGSTGKPKGVAITHRSLVNFLESMRREPGLEASDRLLAVTTVTFDISGLELYLPLVVGACVVLAGRETALDPLALAEALASSGATVMQATPVTWRMLLDSGWVPARPVKALCGGEALPQDLAARLLNAVGPFWNLYGPTETTIWSTIDRIDGNPTRPTIGRPIANTQVYILDRNLQPVPVGIPGELYIGGEGLARGYWRRPDLTDERFLMVASASGYRRLYRTGDLARYWPDGRIEYLGRLDFQVKLRGFRIELGDIETHLRQHPGVSNAAVALREDSPGQPRLVAYLTSAAQVAPTSAEIRSFLAERIPDYMIPSSVVVMDALPLTANGKVDRKSLPAPAQERPALVIGATPPRSSLELELISIWETVLQIRPIGPLDNFFDLGGTSLMAAQAFARIAKLTGKQLPLALLFRAPTIGQLAEAIGQLGTCAPCLVPVQTAGKLPTFFCVHGALGKVLIFRKLSLALGFDQPFYAFEAPDISEDQVEHCRIEEMAERYLRELRAFQPKGPYYLGGLSLGALVTFEMARRLRLEEEAVAVILFDPRLPSSASLWRHPGLLAARMAHVIRRFRSAEGAEKWAYLRNIFQNLRKHQQSRRAGYEPEEFLEEGIHQPLPRNIVLLKKAHILAANCYVPGFLDCKVRLFQSKDESGLKTTVSEWAWKELALCGVDINWLPGGHGDYFRDRWLPELASTLKDVLRQCREEQG